MLAFPLPIVEWEKLEQYRFSTQKGLTTIDSIHFYTFFEDVILTKEEREEKEKSGKPADYIIHDLLELKKIL